MDKDRKELDNRVNVAVAVGIGRKDAIATQREMLAEEEGLSEAAVGNVQKSFGYKCKMLRIAH